MLGLLLLALALPGLLRSRRTPVVARLLAAGALVAIGLFCLDWQQTVIDTRQPELVVVPTAGLDAAGEGFVARQRRTATVDVRAGAAPFAERLAQVVLAPPPADRAREILVLWTGPLVPVPLRCAQAGLRALSLAPIPALAPETWQVRVGGVSARGRPLQVEVETGPLSLRLAQASLVLRVENPRGQEIVRQEVSGEALQARVHKLTFVPAEAGPHTFVFELGLPREGVAWTGRAALAVSEPKPVWIVGENAQELARALAAQSVPAKVYRLLPADLREAQVLVLLDPLARDEQTRIAEFIDAGGGALCVGGEQGGAVALHNEPLGAILPILVASHELPPAHKPAPGAGPGQEPPAQPTPPVQEPPPTRPPPPDQPPPPTPDQGAKGDTSGARPKPDAPLQEVDRRTVALVLVVDRSGSMGEPARAGGAVAKIEYAKVSAFETARALLPGDEIAVVTFGDRGREVLGLTPVEQIETVRAKIEAIGAERESTYVADALRKAQRLLAGSKAAVKHAVVVSDGEIYDYVAAAGPLREMRRAGVTTSLIQIVGGGQVDPVSARGFVELGGGTYATPTNADEVPRLVSLEVRSVLGKAGRGPGDANRPGDGEQRPSKPPDVAKPPEPKPSPPATQPPRASESQPAAATALAVRIVAESQLLAPRPEREFPPLGGIVRGKARPEAHTLLAAGAEGVPLLAFAQRGLGRIGVFSADLTGAWSEGWRKEPGFAARLAGWLAHLEPAETIASSANLLQQVTATPQVPTAAEQQWLAELAGAPLRAAAEYGAPEAREVAIATSRTQELAVHALLVLLALALGEVAVALRARGLRARSAAPMPSSAAPA